MITALISDFANVILLPRATAPQTFLGNVYAQLEDPKSMFDRNVVFNQELLDFFALQKKQNPTLIFAIYSNSAGLLKDERIRNVIKPLFDHVFLSSELGLSKDDPASYQQLTRLLTISAEKAVFIDDKLFNVEAAEAAGLHGIHFTSTDQTIKELSSLI